MLWLALQEAGGEAGPTAVSTEAWQRCQLLCGIVGCAGLPASALCVQQEVLGEEQCAHGGHVRLGAPQGCCVRSLWSYAGGRGQDMKTFSLPRAIWIFI